MAQIPNSVPLTGVIAPTDSADRFPVTDPIYGIDGLRCVSTSAERDAIPDERKRHGMLVFTQDDGRYWSLQPNGGWLEFTVNADTLHILITNIVTGMLPAPAAAITTSPAVSWSKITEGNPVDAEGLSGFVDEKVNEGLAAVSLEKAGSVVTVVAQDGSLDTILSLNKRLNIKNPVDRLLDSPINRDLLYPSLAGLVIALNGQADRTENGVYQANETGALARYEAADYYGIYNAGSLFRSKADDSYWFIPITKNVHNTDGDDAFNFIQLPETAIKMGVLDDYEQAGYLIRPDNDGEVSANLFLPRPLPDIMPEGANYNSFIVNVCARLKDGSLYGPGIVLRNNAEMLSLWFPGPYSEISLVSWDGRLATAYLLDEMNIRLLAPEGGSDRTASESYSYSYPNEA